MVSNAARAMASMTFGGEGRSGGGMDELEWRFSIDPDLDQHWFNEGGTL